MKQKRFIRRLFFPAIAIIGGLVIGAFIAEVVIRVFHLSKTFDSFREQDKVAPLLKNENYTIGYTRQPESQYAGTDGTFYRFNEKGYREKTIDTSGQTKLRIAILGDSVAEGFGVNAGSRYSDLLRQLLQHAEVWNFGIAGHATFDQLNVLKQDVLPLQPDRVILQVCANDILRNEQIYDYYITQSKPVPKDGFQSRRWYRMVLNQSALFLFLAEHWDHLKLRNNIPNERLPSAGTFTERQWELTFHGLRAMKAACDSAGVNFSFMYVPLAVESIIQSDSLASYIPARFDSFSRAEGVASLAVTPLFRKAEDPGELFIDGCHLSPEGHFLVAGFLKKQLY